MIQLGELSLKDCGNSCNFHLPFVGGVDGFAHAMDFR